MSVPLVFWLVGHTLDSESSSWEFKALCSDREAAVLACSKQSDFVAPVVVDKIAPEKSEYFPEAFYPARRAGA